MESKILTAVTTVVFASVIMISSQNKSLAETKNAQSGKPAAEVTKMANNMFAQKITTTSKIDKMKAKETVKIKVKVKNISNEKWLGMPAKNCVGASYHWLDGSKNVIVFEGNRTHLTKDLLPGKSERLELKIKAPDTPGSYRLQITMFQRGIAWFDKKGAKTLDIPVTVTE